MELTSVKNFEFKPSNIARKEVPPTYIKVAMSNELIRGISNDADVNSNKFTTEVKLDNRSVSIFVWKFKLSDWKGAPLGNVKSAGVDPELMSLINSHPEVKTNGQLLSLLQDEFGSNGLKLFSKATGSDVGNAIMYPDKPFTLPSDGHAVALSIRFYENGKYSSKVNPKANSTYVVLYNQSEEKKALSFAADTGKKFAAYISDDAADFINNKSGSVTKAIESSLDSAGLTYDSHNNSGSGYTAWIDYNGKSIRLSYNGRMIILSAFHDMSMADKVADKKWQPVEYKANVSSSDDVHRIDFAGIVDDLYNRRNTGKLLREYSVD